MRALREELITQRHSALTGLRKELEKDIKEMGGVMTFGSRRGSGGEGGILPADGTAEIPLKTLQVAYGRERTERYILSPRT
eukprot:1196391-Prorocentrum_minimum.AAC.4